ncbi:hypothetical protein TeGR_g2250, partial [Tetraparma gracilis]
MALWWFKKWGNDYPTGITFTMMCGLSFLICFGMYTLIDVTPFRVLLGLTGPSPLFPKGLFKPSPLFAEGVKFCKPYCGLKKMEEDEQTLTSSLSEAPDGKSFSQRLQAGGAAGNVVNEVIYGKFGLNNMSQFDLVGEKLKHHHDNHGENLGYDDGVVLHEAPDSEQDWWSLPSTEVWQLALGEHGRLVERVRELEGRCEGAGVEVGKFEGRWSPPARRRAKRGEGAADVGVDVEGGGDE